MIIAFLINELFLREKAVGLLWVSADSSPIIAVKGRTPDGIRTKLVPATSSIDAVVVNLNEVTAPFSDAIKSIQDILQPRVLVGFCAHVDTGLFDQAAKSGIHWAVPRSTFFTQAPQKLYELLSTQGECRDMNRSH